MEEEGYLVFVSFRFPPGPSGVMRVSLWYGETQLIPTTEEWIRGDDEVVWDLPLWELPGKNITLKIKAYNTSSNYDHSCIVRILVLPKEIVKPVLLIGRLLNAVNMLIRLLAQLFTRGV